MASMIINNTTPISMRSASFSSTMPPENCTDTDQYHKTLISINSVVLVTGVISLTLMIHILKSSSTSVTSTAVLNLIFAHFIFLVTVPFRIYYNVTERWVLGPALCKVVSVMIHIHMYMSFILYVIILITRLMPFYCRKQQLVSCHRMYAFLISALVWIVVLVVVPCVVYFAYGFQSSKNENCCFHFGVSITDGALVLNYIASTLIILVATVLTALQANVLRVLYRKHQGSSSQQEFEAQLKSLCFALVMVICFIPYHVFRLCYFKNIEQWENINEVFLSLTTLNCLDMLTFLGRRTFYMCFFMRGVCA